MCTKSKFLKESSDQCADSTLFSLSLPAGQLMLANIYIYTNIFSALFIQELIIKVDVCLVHSCMECFFMCITQVVRVFIINTFE